MKKMTTKELLALPDDGVRRWLIDGELREESVTVRQRPTVRNRFHSRSLIRVGQYLANWLDQQPEPRGQILGGEAGVRISHDPDTTVGIDVVYISHDVIVQQTDETTLIVGVPTLVVEILSPNDTQQAIYEKMAGYRRAKVPVVPIFLNCDPPTLMKGLPWYALPKKTAYLSAEQLETVEPDSFGSNSSDLAARFQKLFQRKIDDWNAAHPLHPDPTPI